MADDPQAIQKTEAKQQPEPAPAAAQPADDATINPEYVPAEQALKKLDKPEVLSLAAFFSSKMTLGPDPESAKLMAQTEMHAETSKLDAYKESLRNRDKQNERDHEFRCTKLNHDNWNLKIILGVAVLGCIGGVALLLNGHQLIGSNVLLASAITVLNLVGGKSPFSGGKD